MHRAGAMLEPRLSRGAPASLRPLTTCTESNRSPGFTELLREPQPHITARDNVWKREVADKSQSWNVRRHLCRCNGEAKVRHSGVQGMRGRFSGIIQVLAYQVPARSEQLLSTLQAGRKRHASTAKPALQQRPFEFHQLRLLQRQMSHLPNT